MKKPFVFVILKRISRALKLMALAGAIYLLYCARVEGNTAAFIGWAVVVAILLGDLV